MSSRKYLLLDSNQTGAVICLFLCCLPQMAIAHSLFFKSEMNCSQFCSCLHNAMVNTMKQSNIKHFPIMGEKYRPEISYFDAKSDYMTFLGTFAPILHRIAEISCTLSDGLPHSIMSLLNGIDEIMDIAMDVNCRMGETLVWDVPSFHTSFNIFFSKNCNIMPKETQKAIVVPMNMWILDIFRGGPNALSLLDIRYTMNTLTFAVMGSSSSSTPEQWRGVYMESASYISLRDNDLEEFDCPFRFSRRLDTLNLEKNRISNFPACVLHPTIIKATYLSLGHNRISDLTLLFEVPENSVMPEIAIINLSYNQLRSLESIRRMGNLLVLDLSHNAIKDITEDAFDYLTSLEVLYLSHNKIYSIAFQQFASNHKLSLIDLSHNFLIYILPEQLPKVPFPLTLDVRHNRLNYPPFRDCAKSKLGNIHTKIYSAGNPFFCDCNMIEFENCQKWINEHTLNLTEKFNIFKDLESMVCANPRENRDLILSDISFQSKCIVVDECPGVCSCSLNDGESLVINCSGRRLLEMPDSLPSYHNASTILFLDHNPLQMLSHRPYLPFLSELHMDNCLLTSVTPAAMASLQNIRVLTLHNNLLQKLPSSTRNITLNHARNVTLYNNRWSCACDSLWLPRWITKHKSSLWMPGSITCQYLRKPVEELTDMDLNCNASSYIDTFLAITLTFTSLVSTLVLVICYRSEISILLYSKLGWHLDCGFSYGDFFSPYDAFISYSQDTYMWVVDTLVPHLESSAKKYRLCLHYRDFPTGETLVDSLPWSIRLSRCAILVLSKDVIKKEWCLMEVRAAFQRLLLVAKNLLIITVNDVNIEDLTPDLQSYMKSNTYLRSTDPCFWEKLEMFLPAKQINEVLDTESASVGAGDSLMQSTADKMEDTGVSDISELTFKGTDPTEAEIVS